MTGRRLDGRTGRVTLDLGPSSPRVDAALAQLAHLFPERPGGPDVHVGLGPAPSGWRTVETWRVLPHGGAPLFLVPPDGPAARRVLLSHNGLRPAKVRLARAGAAAAVPVVAALRGGRDLLRVSVPDGVDDAEVAEHLVTRHLVARVPGARATAVSLRAFHPLAKPTVQVLDAAGRVAAFTKVASDPATAARVERESALLADLGGRLTGDVRLPRLLDRGRCGPFTVSVVAPLPAHVRGARVDDEPRVLARLRTFQAATGDGRSCPLPLAATTLWPDLRARAAAVTGPAGARPDLAAALAGLVAAVDRDDAGRELATGAFHGDWVPWNMGWDGDVLWLWDLEYGSALGPAGLDALRWVYQVEHVVRGRSLTDAVAAMTAAASRVLPPAGGDPADVRTLVRVHLVAVFVTALETLAAGRGLPPGLDPDALAVLQEHSA